MFGKKKQPQPPVPFDPENQMPILKCSICNGEQVAGFKDKDTGKFHEVMLIRSELELKNFLQMYGLTQVEKEY